MRRYIALLLLVPLLDSLFLVFVATRIGGPLTVLIVVLTALLGLLLVRAESRHTVRTIQEKLSQGEIPTNEVLDGALLLVAGALTLTPGLVTDFIGIMLVIPPTRIPIRMGVKKYVVVPYLDKKSEGFATGNVYIGGFPFDQGAGPGGPGSPGGEAGDAYDLDDDAYDIDFDDDSDSRPGVE